MPAMEYCELKSAVATVRVTFTVPLPVSVPAPLMRLVAPGVRVTFVATVKLPDALIFKLTLKPLVLLILTTLNATVEEVVPSRFLAPAGVGLLKFTVLAVV